MEKKPSIHLGQHFDAKWQNDEHLKVRTRISHHPDGSASFVIVVTCPDRHTANDLSQTFFQNLNTNGT